MRKRFAGLTAAVVVAAGLAGPAPAQLPVASMDAPALAACHHYDNRARFKAREGDVEFVAVLADACAAARAALTREGGATAQGAAAERFLSLLGQGRATIVAIDRERMALAGETGAGRDVAVEFRRHRRLVSTTGEFLILRQVGVFAAMRAWVDAGADFTLARALP